MHAETVAGVGAWQVTVPYLRSEYGKEYDFDAPVKLLDAMMHEQALGKGQHVVVLGQVLAADINIGYEELVNIRVRSLPLLWPQPGMCMPDLQL
jgi:hypothetical protein